ncbi:MAG: hypothetical protein CM15mP96_1140 [Gammaproteobacteria bacterium]|nr:MAG: hypothetical protein CM15mP96_1140 [Gammaproteobacteria bacterium]
MKSKIYSGITKKVYPKSDICLIKNNINKELLVKENFYLNENNKLLEENFNKLYVPDSGISIKLKTNKYTQ